MLDLFCPSVLSSSLPLAYSSVAKHSLISNLAILSDLSRVSGHPDDV